MADSPYPELKKTHTAARTGTPWRDRKPAPAAPVWGIIQGLGTYWTLVAALELGVFDTIGTDRRVTAQDLATALDVSPPHLRSLLDSLVAIGVLELVDGRYGLNETAERYLTTDGAASMVDLVTVAPGPLGNWTHLADTVRHGRVTAPIEDDAAAFYRPLVSATYPTQRRVAMFTARAIGFARWPGSPRVLDLGAGAAPWTIGLLEAHPSATAVVNDLPDVLDLAAARLADVGLSDRCELRPGDFHAVPLEPGGSDVVVLGHVTRTEGIDGARHLIGRAHEALRTGGRLLLADYFADPEPTRNPFGALMGTTMVANTRRGSTFTNEQYVEWLQGAGFGAVRLLEPIGFQFVYVATAR
jgi:ubiquinone/menaquinone biosynthesis C-methylase UbiE